MIKVNNGLKGALLAGTIISGLAFAAPALAQDAQQQPETVVVTGSRLVQKNLITTSPITAVSGADIDVAGVTRVEDLVNQLPQAFAAQNSTVSNGASGTAEVDLRGLGPARTLVLMDGRRMPYGSPNSVPSDLNAIPGQLVERVEVLTGGASAVYGSDALAGVVNFIMRKNLQGFEVNAQYGMFSHSNDYDGVGNLRNVIAGRAATNPAQFALPKDDVTDGRGTEITLALGSDLADGKGHITAYAGYRRNTQVLQRDRDFSACSLNAVTSAAATSFACGGSGTASPARVTDFATYDYVITPAGFNNWASTNQYNFGPTNFYQRPDERYIMGAYGNYEINKHAELFTNLMFVDYTSNAQIAPSGFFLGGATVDLACNNPLLNAAQRTGIGCTAADILAGNTMTTFIGKRNTEGGPRQDHLNFQTYRAVVGVKGELTTGWSYDLAAQFSKVKMGRVYKNELSTKRSALALDVIPDPVTGAPVCRAAVTGVDTSCVPWNIWSPGGVTSAALDYVGASGFNVGSTTQQVVTLAIQGDLGATAGIKSPWAEDGVSVGFGMEYRRETVETSTDLAFSSGDLAGQGGPTFGLEGATASTDIFGEAKIPVAAGKPFADQISIDLAYRYSKYTSGKETNTYKIGADWAPVKDLRFRTSFQSAARAANVIELFQGRGNGLFDMDEDPCMTAGATVVGSTLRTRCLATGVPVANLGNTAVLESPAGQYNNFGGGTETLTPETSETVTVGFVWQPSFIKGFNLSVDYFNIKVEDVIGTVGGENTINACYYGGNNNACSRIHRNALGNLWTAGGQVDDFNVNLGSLETAGIDFNANYRLDLADIGIEGMGKVNLNLVGTLLDKLATDPGDGIPEYDCVGKFASQANGGLYTATCGIPNPEWRHRFRASWSTPWDVTLSGTWRHYGKVSRGGSFIDSNFDAENYFDLSADWDIKDNLSLRAGVNNILDNDPPLSGSVGTTGNGNTYPQTYDALGRWVFVGVTAKF